MRRLKFLCAICILAANLPAEEPGYPELLPVDAISRVCSLWRQLTDKDKDKDTRLGQYSCSNRDYERAAAAFLLAESFVPEAKEALGSLLKDPDWVVRRVAAEAQFGKRALTREFAALYGYASVLDAEEKARKIFNQFGSDPAARAESTQALSKLGHPAIWEIRRWENDKIREIGLSARFASQEIDARRENIRPDWAVKLMKAFTKKISFELSDAPLKTALEGLGKHHDVPIVFDERLPKEALDTPINLRVTDMSMDLAVEWVLKPAEKDYVLRDGAVVVVNAAPNVTFSSVCLLDVRDLISRDYKPDWKELLKENGILQGDGLNSTELLDGFLFVHGDYGPDLRKRLAGVRKVLNQERAKRGLPEVDVIEVEP